MKLLITGADGQLGTELQRQALIFGWDILAVDQELLDVADLQAVQATVKEYSPNVLINAAAYTAVDKAEEDVELAFAVNKQGPENLAIACELVGIPLIHYSTDYVFDGSKEGAYAEVDTVSPPGVYGESKLAGELAVQKYCLKHLIFRTSWVFSAHGNNFVKTMLKLGAEREELGIVSDQYGKPTSAAELARVTLEILPRLNHQHQWGVYHLAQPEATNWHSFAKTIFDEAIKLNMPLKVGCIKAIATEAYPTPAKRPENSELSCDKIEQTFGITVQPWRISLPQVIKELKNAQLSA